MKKKKLVTYFLIFLFSYFLVGINFCLAEGLVPEGGKATGDYSLNDIVGILPTAANWMLGIVGSLALLMFVYGGLMIMLAGETTITGTEKTTKVNKGKDAIRNAIVGLIIVFASYIIIGFVFRATGIDPKGTAWSSTSWFESK